MISKELACANDFYGMAVSICKLPAGIVNLWIFELGEAYEFNNCDGRQRVHYSADTDR